MTIINFAKINKMNKLTELFKDPYSFFHNENNIPVRTLLTILRACIEKKLIYSSVKIDYVLKFSLLHWKWHL